MAFTFRNKDVNKIYLGDNEVQRVYLGDTLVYGSEPEPAGGGGIRLNSTRTGLIFPAGSYSSTAETTWYDKNYEKQTGIRTVTFDEETEVDALNLVANQVSTQMFNNIFYKSSPWDFYCVEASLEDFVAGSSRFDKKLNSAYYDYSPTATSPYYSSMAVACRSSLGNTSVTVTHVGVKINADYLINAGYTPRELSPTWDVLICNWQNTNFPTSASGMSTYRVLGSNYKLSLYDSTDTCLFTVDGTVQSSLVGGYQRINFTLPEAYQSYTWRLGDYLKITADVRFTMASKSVSSYPSYPVLIAVRPFTNNYWYKVNDTAEFRKVGISRFPGRMGSEVSLEQDYENVWDLGYIETSTTEANVAEAYHSTLPTNETTE